jgi:long-chain acyl-CoA synthetase
MSNIRAQRLLHPVLVNSDSKLAPTDPPTTMRFVTNQTAAGTRTRQEPIVKCSADPSQRAKVLCLQCSKYFSGKHDRTVHAEESKRGHKRFPISQLKSYVAVDGSNDGESCIRRNWATRNGPILAPIADCKTLHDTFRRSARLFSDRPCFGVRQVSPTTGSIGDFAFQTYKQVATRVNHVGSALKALGIEKRARIGLYSINRPEWVIAELACHAHSLVPVPLYDTLGPEAAQFVVTQADISVVFCSIRNVKNVQALADSGECKSLKYIVVMPAQPFEPEQDFQLPSSGVSGPTFVRFQDLEAQGKASPFAHDPPRANDLATMCYTSGTTGNPKGAMLRHSNLVSDMAACQHHGIDAKPDDVHLSFLPLAHMFERVVLHLMLASGAAIGFSRGDPTLLLEDIETLRPTIFVAVPRLYNRLYDKIIATIHQGGSIKRWLFSKAYASKEDTLRTVGGTQSFIWDRIIFSKVAAKLGGRIRLMVTGSAPIAANVLEFLRIAFSCEVIEGYGMTETTAAACVQTRSAINPTGNVGVPLVCTEIKLVDVPEMGYTSKDIINGIPQPRGEVWMRGTNIFSGYYKNAEKTAEALTEDGWIRSGDIGMWLSDQTLKIIDRKKNIFKLAQGEYIAPEKIENVYSRSRYIAQMFVYGDSIQPYLVGIVVPDEEELTAWAASHGLAGVPFAELIHRPQVVRMIEQDMQAVAKAGKLRGFEKVKKVQMSSELFSVDNALLTPTFKLKRNVAREHFADEIASMYDVNQDGTGPQLQSKL